MSAGNSRTQIRSALKGTGIFTVGAAASAVAWGWGLNVWIPLGFAGYLALDALLATLARRPPRSLAPFPEMPPAVGKFAKYSWRDECACYGTTMLLRGTLVAIDLRTDRQLEGRKRAALELIAGVEALAKNFETFRAQQMQAQPEEADEIGRLRLDFIGLHSRSAPNGGDVYFTVDSQLSDWSCAIEGMKFFNLAKDG